MNPNNKQFQQNLNAMIQDLKTMTIPNPKGNASVVSLRSCTELPQTAPQQKPKPTDAESEPDADSLMPQQARSVPLPFPNWTLSTRKAKTDEDLLKMFYRIKINIPLLDAIKQIPKYAKFRKELCMHKRKNMEGEVELGGVVSALTKNEEVTTRSHQTLPKKCQDLKIFSVLCTIGECTFVSAMLDLGASINVMATSIYKSLNFGDLEPTGMTIQLANRIIMQPLGVLEVVLVHVNELIFRANFYVLDMEDEASGKGSTLIMGRPFLMTARTKIDVHAGMLSMEFNDNLVQFNIFEAMKHPTEDPSLFGIDVIDELVVNYMQLEAGSAEFQILLKTLIPTLVTIWKPSPIRASQVPNPNRVGQLKPRAANDASPLHSPPVELKLLSSHLKHVYLDNDQQFPIIIANNLYQEQEERLMQEEAHPIRQQQRRLNLTILDVVKKEVTKLLAAEIVYPISNS
ncbi:hypothetical protein CR513_28895, partial [Mucuna pruriens]